MADYQIALVVSMIYLPFFTILWELGRIKEVHHYYYGWALTLIPQDHIQVLGVLICADDYFQHFLQLIWPKFTSPLHKLYTLVYSRAPLIRRLNAWLDSLFGRRS